MQPCLGPGMVEQQRHQLAALERTVHEEGRQHGDAEASDGGLHQRLAVVGSESAASSHWRGFFIPPSLR